MAEPDELLGSVVQAARRGDSWAQEEISERIRSFARHVYRPGGATVMPDIDWEDIAQEASRAFFSSGIERFHDGGPLSSYLYTIVRRTYLQLARSARRRRERDEIGESVGQQGSDPEIGTYLYRVLVRLPGMCRRLLERLYFDGATYSELALELGLAESSVRVRASRCLGKAREIV